MRRFFNYSIPVLQLILLFSTSFCIRLNAQSLQSTISGSTHIENPPKEYNAIIKENSISTYALYNSCKAEIENQHKPLRITPKTTLNAFKDNSLKFVNKPDSLNHSEINPSDYAINPSRFYFFGRSYDSYYSKHIPQEPVEEGRKSFFLGYGYYGMGIGHVPAVYGLRLQYRDFYPHRVKGLNLTIRSPERATNSSVKGLALGLPFTGSAKIYGLSLALAGITAEQKIAGLSLSGAGIVSEGSIFGTQITLVGIGAGYHIKGIQFGGLGIGSGGDLTGIQIGGIGMGSGGDITGITMAGIGFGSGGSAKGINIAGFGFGVSEHATGINLAGFGFGSGGSAKGINIAGFGFGVSEHATGINLAGFGFGSGGSATGVNIAGFGFGTANRASGINVAGLGFGTGGSFTGLNIAGFGMGAGDNINGLSVAGAGIVSENSLRGAAISGFGITAVQIQGLAISPVVRTDTHVRGIILAPVFSRTKENGILRGFSLSSVNYIPGQQTGLTIGIFNYARNLRGVQLGILNYAGNNPKVFQWLPLINMNLNNY